jgi:hypothetical protein
MLHKLNKEDYPIAGICSPPWQCLSQCAPLCWKRPIPALSTLMTQLARELATVRRMPGIRATARFTGMA